MKNNNNKQRKKSRSFDRNLLTQQRKNMNKRQKENYLIKINKIKANAPDHNAINLSKSELTEAQKSLLIKGLSFVPTLSDVNWYEIRKDFDKFVNQLRFKANNTLEANSYDTTNDNISISLNAPKKALIKNCTVISYKRNEIQELRNIY